MTTYFAAIGTASDVVPGEKWELGDNAAYAQVERI